MKTIRQLKTVILTRCVMLFVGLICIASVAVGQGHSSFTVAPVFGDGMVLQRGIPIRVFGTAEPGRTVVVRLDESVATATAGADGAWRAILPERSAGGPLKMDVSGPSTITFGDVWIGEVWLASGQSNMEWPVVQSDDGDALIETADQETIHLFQVQHNTSAEPLTGFGHAGWKRVSPESVARFSAVGYAFAREIQAELGVHVGIIQSTWGGTPAESWTSAATLNAHVPAYSDQILALNQTFADVDRSNRQLSRYYQGIDDPGIDKGQAWWADSKFDDSDWAVMTVPGPWEGALSEFDGVVWMRKTVRLSGSWAGASARLNLGEIDDIDSTWVNGILVGSTQRFRQTREYSIPAGLLTEGVNTVTVRIIDTGGQGGLMGGTEPMVLANSEQTVRLDGLWKLQQVDRPADMTAGPVPALQRLPSTLYNAMIHPLIPFGIRGAIWYQGESNAGKPLEYRTLFPAMIQDWRDLWGLGDFPFYYVQLAGYLKPQENPVEKEIWPELREAQRFALRLRNVGEASSIDIGEPDDIHPRNKTEVGRRLALLAMNRTYHSVRIDSGPELLQFSRRGDGFELVFGSTGGGLDFRPTPLTGFAVAGEDRVFYWADVKVHGNSLMLSSKDVPDPVAVRYGWGNHPAVTLFGATGLPASPFRTDDWEGVSGGK